MRSLNGLWSSPRAWSAVVGNIDAKGSSFDIKCDLLFDVAALKKDSETSQKHSSVGSGMTGQLTGSANVFTVDI